MKIFARKLVFMFLPMLPAVASAAQPLGLDAEFLHEAGYVEAGPVRIYPTLGTSVGYDSNIFESEHDTQSSTVTHVVPELDAVLPMNSGFLELGAMADDIRYTESSADNFTDRMLYARGLLEANSRNRFNLDAGYLKSHDPRGTGLTEGFNPVTSTLDEPDAYTDQNAAIKYEYGAATAAGKLRFAADFLDHSYDNHRDRTRYFDRDEYGAGATFLWRVLPRTALALEGRERRIDYAEDNPAEPSLNSREHSVLAGAEWGVTDYTGGSLRVGNRRKNFDSSERVDGSDFVWEVNANWRPRSYSKFELKLERTPHETNGTGDFIDTRSSLIRWTHDWTERVGTQLTFSYLKESYQSADRDENTKIGRAGINYKMRRWLIWHLDGEWRSRASNIAELEFERNRYWLTAEFRL